MGGRAYASRRGAAVIGGSLSGLLAARVLADHFERVFVLERDPRPRGPSLRPGTPQAAHAHVLLSSGHRVLEKLFPGIAAQLCERGAIPLDFASDLHFFHHDSWRVRFPSRLRGTLQSRSLLEWQLGERLLELGNVELVDRASARSLLADASGEIRGVELVLGNDPQRVRELEVDLVVDASGRGSRGPNWLGRLGHAAPREERIRIDLGYASRLMRPASHAFEPPWKALLVYPKPPGQSRVGYLFTLEGNRWLVTLAGYRRDWPGAGEREFLEFCRSLPDPSVYEAVRSAEPLSEIRTYRFLRQIWRRYDLLPRHPRSLLFIGDAVCSLNPLFGHGMSLSASEAVILGRCIAAWGDDWDALARDYYRRLRRLLADPWLLSAVEASRFRRGAAPWSPARAALQWYSSRVFDRCSHDRVVCEHFLEVFHLTEGLRSIARPRVVARVILGGRDV